MSRVVQALPSGPERDNALRRQRLALDAFAKAKLRLEDARHSTGDSYGAAGEALFWAIACEEGLEALLGSVEYRRGRDADGDGRLMPGIRWARNRMGHQLAVVHEKHFGSELGHAILGLAVLGTVDHMRWLDASKIPPGDTAGGRDEYNRLMAGGAVTATIKGATGG